MLTGFVTLEGNASLGGAKNKVTFAITQECLYICAITNSSSGAKLKVLSSFFNKFPLSLVTHWILFVWVIGGDFG